MNPIWAMLTHERWLAMRAILALLCAVLAPQRAFADPVARGPSVSPAAVSSARPPGTVAATSRSAARRAARRDETRMGRNTAALSWSVAYGAATIPAYIAAANSGLPTDRYLLLPTVGPFIVASDLNVGAVDRVFLLVDGLVQLVATASFIYATVTLRPRDALTAHDRVRWLLAPSPTRSGASVTFAIAGF